MSAALEVIRQKGQTSLTMREVAAVAKTGLGALYRHFPSKDDLLAAMLDEVAENLTHPAKNHDPVEEIVSIFVMLRKVFGEEPWIIDVLASGDRVSVHILPLLERVFTAFHELGASPDASTEIFDGLMNYTYGDVTSHTLRRQNWNPERAKTSRELISDYPLLSSSISHTAFRRDPYEANIRGMLLRLSLPMSMEDTKHLGRG